MKEMIKNLAENIPFSVGRLLNRIPMQLRLGESYSTFSNEINAFEKIEYTKQKQIKLFSEIAKYAQSHTQFYLNEFSKLDLLNHDHIDLNAIKNYPIITKKMLQSAPLKTRSIYSNALKKNNTGGTTGQPLDFYIEKSAYAREWAHMHAIWARLGYHYTDEKMTLRGRNIGRYFYKYNFNQNEFLINTYMPIKENLAACSTLIINHNIKWIHGYPSSIYSFLRELEAINPQLFEILIKKVQGVFLGSEFPSPIYRDYLENHCELRTISWYGHSEMGVLAAERDPGSGLYYPFHSYGLAEAVKDGDTYRLIATSLHNYASPFIRYDTGDLIEPTFNNELLECFRIKEGRNSDSVIDKNGRTISLTGLIFGRHHEAFNFIEHVQVKQQHSGTIEILITSKKYSKNWGNLFDFSNTFFDIKFTQISSPVRSSSGKVPLLVR